MKEPALVAQLDARLIGDQEVARLTCDQEVAGSDPPGLATFFHGD